MKRAVRSLAARPSFTIVAIATLALGFGVNAAVFSLTRTVLLRPLPYRDADRLVQVNETNRARGLTSAPIAPANFAVWRERASAFEEVAAFRRVSFNVSAASSTDPRAEQVEGFIVSPSFFAMLGVQPAVGRPFEAGEGTRGRDDVVLVTDGFWRRFFNADPGAVGRTISVDGVRCTVVGVLPPSFKIFRVLNRQLDLFRPLVIESTERVQSINVWARLKPGVPIEAGQAELTAIYDTLPIPERGWTADLSLLATRFAAGPRPVLVALEWAVALVLLIACANVANLLLALAADRRTELAVRQALGANRWRIARDLGSETLVLAAAGAALAVLLAAWSVAALNAIVSFQDVSRLEPFRVDGWVMAFTAALAATVVVLFGLLTARAATQVDLIEALKDSTHGVARSAANRGLRRSLIVGEVALSIVLTVAALALMRGAMALHDQPRGVAVDGVMSAQIALNDPVYADPARLARTAGAIVEKLGSSPAVRIATLVNYLPLSLIRVGAPVDIEGVPRAQDTAPPATRYFVVAPRYFEAVGIRLAAGRDFTAADDSTKAGVAIVSESFARRFWNTTDVIGRRVQPQFGDGRAFWIPRGTRGMLTIVGVVTDVSEEGLLDSAGFPQLYLPYAQNPTVVATIVARSANGSAAAAAAAIRDAVRAIDPQLPVSYEMTFDEVLRETFARPRELAWLIGTFAVLALLLSAGGVYAVMSFVTSTRAREIAIRLAVGATRTDVVALVVRDAIGLAAAGGAIGVLATPLAFRLLSAAVYGIGPWQPAILVSVTIGLVVICAGAAALPAWRATREPARL